MPRWNFIPASRFLLIFGENILTFILPIIAFKFRGVAGDSGLILSINFLARLTGYPIAGFFCDRFDEKIIVFLNSVLRSAFCCICFVVLKSFHLYESVVFLWILFFLSAFDGLLGGVTGIAFEAIGPRLCQTSELPKYQGWIQTADQLALFLAPLCGSLLLKLEEKCWIFSALAVLFATSFVAFWMRSEISTSDFWRKSSITATSLRKMWMSDIGDSFRAILAKRLLIVILILTLLDNFLLGLYSALSVPLAFQVFGLKEQELGWVMTLAHGVSLLCALSLEWVQKMRSTQWIWYGSYFVAYLGFILLGISRNHFEFAVAVVFIELSCAAGIFALRLIRAQAIPHQSFGKVSSILFLLQQMSLPLGGFLIAPFIKTELLQSSFLLWSSLTGAITALLLGYVFRLK